MYSLVSIRFHRGRLPHIVTFRVKKSGLTVSIRFHRGRLPHMGQRKTLLS